MIKTLTSILEILGIHIIPLWVAFVSAFSDPFVRMFIRDAGVRSDFSDGLDYLLTGQGILICPLGVLIIILKHTMIGNKFTGTSLFLVAAYLAVYVTLLGFYLRMNPDQFVNSISLRIRWFYKLAPLLFVIASLVIELLAA